MRRGDSGEAVAMLQKALHSLGYDVGPRDGIFGYMTLDAVRQFQREHRLRTDGIAGPQVLQMLFHPEQRVTRRVHVVQRGEGIADIARQYDVSVEALRRSNRLHRRRPLYEGQRLVIRYRTLLGASSRVNDAREVAFLLRKVGRHLSGLGGLQFGIGDDGRLNGSWDGAALDECKEHALDTFAVVHTPFGSEADPDLVRRILRSRRQRSALLHEIEGLAHTPELDGIVLDIAPFAFGDGAAYLRWVEAMRERLRKAGKQLIVGVPVVPPGVRGRLLWADLNLGRLARSADLILLQSHRMQPGVPPLTTPKQLHLTLRRLSRAVPVWKSLLGVFAGAWEQDVASGSVRHLSYQQGMVAVYGRGSKPVWDEALGLAASEGVDPTSGERRRLWIADAKAVDAKLQLVERLNLRGAFITPLGGEDQRIWQRLPRHITPLRHEVETVDIGID